MPDGVLGQNRPHRRGTMLPGNFREVLDKEVLDPKCLYGLEGRGICRDPACFETFGNCARLETLLRGSSQIGDSNPRVGL